jgi:hypothetical protein
VKADSASSCKTASGYPAMKYSDGTYVGCEDAGDDTDITKGRVKFSHAIGSLYVDSLVDGYTTDGYADAIDSNTNVQTIAEEFIDFSFNSFDTWSENIGNNIITTLSHPSGANQPAVFALTTTSDSGVRFGRLDVPVSADDFTGDFVVDWTASRITWPVSSVTTGQVSAFMTAEVSNLDGSGASYNLGWRSRNGSIRLFFDGIRTNSSSVVISTFSYEINAPDALGDEVLFRFRRINDVIFAYYVVPDAISDTENPFGQYVRIGSNPEIQAGTGTVSLSYEISQNTSPNPGLSFFVSLHDLNIRHELVSAASSSLITIGRTAATQVINRVAATFPVNLNSRTSVISANLILTSNSAGIFNDTFNIIPLDILDADNLSIYYDYPITQNSSLITSFSPGTIAIGDEITIDISNAIRAFIAEPGHLPGYIKGFIIEPDTSVDSEFVISNSLTLEIGYEDTTTGVIFKVGISIDPSTGIATFDTRNILYDAIDEQLRTVVNFGVYLKKSGFINQDVSISIADLNKIGLGTCQDETVLDEDDECFFIAGSTATGVFVQGPFPCVFHLP